MTVTEVASGETVTVYNQSPATKGLFNNVWSNKKNWTSTITASTYR